MYYFINCLRALAATLITNAHYTNVYPISIIANGGLLGDILFFAVSGFCLYNIKLKFIFPQITNAPDKKHVPAVFSAGT